MIAWLVAAALAGGWRGDGTGVVDADAPTRWSSTEGVDWVVPLPSGGNASPVRFGPNVCVPVEPATLVCVDATTGRPAWTAEHDLVAALPEARREDVARRVAEAERAQAALPEARRTYSAAQRDARRDPTGQAASALAGRSARIQALEATVAAADAYRRARPRDIMGYTTETPVTDGSTLWWLGGDGVLSAHGLDGSLRWSAWWGPSPDTMRGYHLGTSASPVLAGDVLVVPYGELRGLDPQTGRVLWSAGPYPDYGTPAVATIDGVAHLALPDGRVLRAADGSERIAHLDEVWFVGPHARDADVWWIGGRSAQANRERGAVLASAYRLVTNGQALRAELRWRTRLEPTSQAWVTSPVAHDGWVYSVSGGGVLHVLRDDTGVLVTTLDLAEHLGGGAVYPSPMVVGEHLHISSETGHTAVLTLGSSPRVVADNDLEPFRSTPMYEDGALFVHGATRLWRISGHR